MLWWVWSSPGMTLNEKVEKNYATAFSVNQHIKFNSKNLIQFQGYTDWKHTFMGDSKKSVPDSCCLFDTPG